MRAGRHTKPRRKRGYLRRYGADNYQVSARLLTADGQVRNDLEKERSTQPKGGPKRKLMPILRKTFQISFFNEH
jgi:hypothetical protein